MQIKNQKLTDDAFFAEREEVLKQWPTGKGVDLDEAVEYQKKIPASKRFGHVLARGVEEKVTLIQPRAGVAITSEHIQLLRYLEKEGEADLLPTTVDSYTRLNRYTEAQTGIDKSKETGRSMLNGFPIVNYGVQVCRDVTSALKKPVQVRHGTPDARLLTEISIAGGFTSYEGGGISYNIPYSKDHSLEKTISHWQYTDRLVGLYEEAGVSINREPFGPLTGTLIPASISNSVAVIEALLAATQGVKDITVGYGQCGNLIQDVAAIRALKSVCQEYLDKHGFHDVRITTVFHQWMGGFPQDEAKAFGVISWGAATAALAKATKVIVKTPHEAMGVPTKEANAAGLRATKQVISMLRDQDLRGIPAVLTESAIIGGGDQVYLGSGRRARKRGLRGGNRRRLRGGGTRYPIRTEQIQRREGPAGKGQHGCDPPAGDGEPPLHERAKGFSPCQARRAGQSGETTGQLPNGHR